jgi:hypothetical protein
LKTLHLAHLLTITHSPTFNHTIRTTRINQVTITVEAQTSRLRFVSGSAPVNLLRHFDCDTWGDQVLKILGLDGQLNVFGLLGCFGYLSYFAVDAPRKQIIQSLAHFFFHLDELFYVAGIVFSKIFALFIGSV